MKVRRKVLKYGNKPTKGYPSKIQWRRAQELKQLQREKKIGGLHEEVNFPIAFNNKHICSYRADFVYLEGAYLVIEDVKGIRTAVFNLKWKMLKAFLKDQCGKERWRNNTYKLRIYTKNGVTEETII